MKPEADHRDQRAANYMIWNDLEDGLERLQALSRAFRAGMAVGLAMAQQENDAHSTSNAQQMAFYAPTTTAGDTIQAGADKKPEVRRGHHA